MLYKYDLGLFKEYMQRAIKISGNKCAVYPGIGVFTAHSKITKDLITREAVISRSLVTRGMVFFSGNSFNKEMRDTLKSSLF
jgi:hypothetical protein